MSDTWQPLSGTETVLRSGGYEASIVSLGASLRSFTLDGRDIVVPFAPDVLRPAFRGAVLAPWPNRVLDGRYRFDGADEQLPLTEPDKGHALHGLVAWADWSIVRADDTSVVLATELAPSGGFPHRLAIEARYELGASGLRTTIGATNRGPDRAPWGTSAHPWLAPATDAVPLDDWTLEVPADEVVLVEGDRLLPAGQVPVADSPFRRFRDGDRLEGGVIDHAFTKLARGADGLCTVRVTAPDGFAIAMSWGAELPWVQVCSGDLPDPAIFRSGVAVEPMTCPPDAFNSGTDVVVLEPGESTHASWLLSARQSS